MVAKADSACQENCNFRLSPEAALQLLERWRLLCLSFAFEGWFHGLAAVSYSTVQLILYFFITPAGFDKSYIGTDLTLYFTVPGPTYPSRTV